MMKQQNNPLFGKIKKVGIAAPASLCRKEKLESCAEIFRRAGVEPVFGENISRKGKYSYLSADDPFRIEDFNRFAADDSIDAIFCARGGYGTPRILNDLNYELLRERNLPVIGFSDITALHLAMLSRNAGICVASRMAGELDSVFHSPTTLAGMRRVYSMLSCDDWEYRKTGRVLSSFGMPENVSGGIIPLNLTLAAALCGTGFLPSLQEQIIVLEEVGEPVRKIDRMLHQLIYSSFFKGAAAVVFAQFTDCGKTSERKILFRDFAEKTGIPVFYGLRYGHELPSFSFLFGEPCKIENGNLFLGYIRNK